LPLIGLMRNDMRMDPAFDLNQHSVVAFVPTLDPDRARAFYRDVLGLHLTAEQLPFALVFDAHGTMLRVTVVRELTPPPYTTLGWEVPNLQDAVRNLAAKGIHFERYPGMSQDELGIWTAPESSQIAWFRDPDGNTLSLSQHHRSSE
jgi:catechol 2,3-dioxygenase-like lactoylglutathione lyase family enzyme